MNIKEREKYGKVLDEIVDKYKDNNLIYSKLVLAKKKLIRCNYVREDIYTKLANLTAKINFRCNFEDGSCKSYRDHGHKMCCCKLCSSDFGFLRVVFFKPWDDSSFIEEELLYYAKKFNLKTGFWREGKGCVLPRHKRSQTCLTHNCTSRLTPEERLLLDIIRDCNTHPYYIAGVIEMLKNYFLYREQ